MSTRQLRKIQKQKELDRDRDAAAEASQESGNGEESEPETAKPRVSLFAALGGGDEADDDDGNGHEDDQAADDDGDAPGVDQTAEPPASSKSKKKKKKKKNKKKQAATALPVDPDVTNKGVDDDETEDEIDKAIKDLNLESRGRTVSAGCPERGYGSDNEELMKINPHHLRAINEMRNLFGKEVMEAANTEEQQEIQNPRRQRQRFQQVDLETFLREPPGAPKLPEVSLRRNVFVQGREHWPRQPVGGLTMAEIESPPGGSWTEYAYMHDSEYDTVQSLFFSLVQMGDPMRMVHLLKQYPYHVSTLLQVSSVAKQDQNMALAAELCERALFTFGRVATTSFRQNVELGRARLNFRRPENRQLWLAGYHYLKSLIRKGTYRTALEWAKLLFSLERSDPYAMRHFMHFLAIRAHEAQWLIDLMDEDTLSFHGTGDLYLRQTLVLAHMQLKDNEKARVALVSGMKKLPWLYCALFQELGLDAPPSIWGVNVEKDSRSFWVKLYIYQTKDLWNNPEATALLQAVAKSLDRPDMASLPEDDAPVDLGSARLAYLEGQTSLLSVAPKEMLISQPNYEFDPLPPPKAQNIFSSEGCQLPWQGSELRTLEIQHQMLVEMNQNALLAEARRGPVLAHDDDSDDFEVQRLDDEELLRDIEEHATRPGMMGALMDMLGLRRHETPSDGDGDESWDEQDDGDGDESSDEQDDGDGDESPDEQDDRDGDESSDEQDGGEQQTRDAPPGGWPGV